MKVHSDCLLACAVCGKNSITAETVRNCMAKKIHGSGKPVKFLRAMLDSTLGGRRATTPTNTTQTTMLL